MGAKTFTAVGFAPLYDAVTTRVFPGLGGDRMALKLNGKDDRLTRQDFLSLARTIGLTVEEAEAGLGALATRITERLTSLQLPAFASEFDGARPSVTRWRRRFVPESSRGPPERGADMRGRVVVVNDKMQQGYWYNLTAPVGRDFDPEFRSDLTPAQMLELGVFGRKYMTDTQGEFPAEWFERARLSPVRRDCSLKFFRVDASQLLAVWRAKGWIDPRGLFQWYCRYHMGRRMPEDDWRQIARWKAIQRHIVRTRRNCEPGDLDCCKANSRALLHWAYDSRAF